MKVFVKLFTALNLGDDLFLKILLERYPNTNFILPAPGEYTEIFKDFKNLSVITQDTSTRKNFVKKCFNYFERNLLTVNHKRKIQRKYENFFNLNCKECNAFISIGGSIFMQPKKLAVYSDVVYYQVVNNYFNNAFVIGCNFGPYKNEDYFYQYKDVFNRMSDVCFREKDSRNKFSQLSNVRYAPDIVFGLKYKAVQKIPKSVGFSIIAARNKTDKNSYITKYVELIAFYQSQGYKIYLFSFCKRQGDEDMINTITELLGSVKNINKVFYNGDIDAFLDIYSSVEKMYCGRFHAMILSMLFEQNIYPIVYSKKMTNVLNDINYKGKIILMEDFHSINPQIIYNEITQNYYDIQSQKKESDKQFKMIDLFLNK